MFDWRARFQQVLFVVTAAGLAVGGYGWVVEQHALRDVAWIAAVCITLLAVIVDIVQQLRQGKAGVDVLALFTMAGALALGQYFAGAVIALMVASGRALEEYAGRRSKRELSALLSRQPRFAHRYKKGGLEEVALDSIVAGERLLVRAGEVVPVDGVLRSSAAVLDESALSGEALPVTRERGATLRSGGINAGDAFDLEALASAEQSTYAGIIRLVEEAQQGKAPLARLADRYALWFIPLTLALAGASWLFSGSPVRALAVLVVATPCPLILAVPIAIVAGISRAAQRGLLVKNGGALEALARAETVMFDKTGTLTVGMPRLAGIESDGSIEPDEALRLAASLEQSSLHVSARALVQEARRRDLNLTAPGDTHETPGAGVSGRVEGRRVRVGRLEWLTGGGHHSQWVSGVMRHMTVQGGAGSFLEVDGKVCAVLMLADDIRIDTGRALRELRRAGIQKTVMVSGDRRDIVETIAFALGVDAVIAECSPADKVEAVERERLNAPIIMVGDGINDAPALAAADVGVAMGVHGSATSSEAADAVLLIDRLDRLAEGVLIARRSRRIARQSVLAGMGLSLGAMGFAAAGFIAPVIGAVLQEVIDVAVIVNALRVLARPHAIKRRHMISAEVAEALHAEHHKLRPVLDRIDAAARVVGGSTPDHAKAELAAVARMLRDDLLPHEREDELQLYPKLAGVLSGNDPLAAMSRTHREIFHLARLYGRLLEDIPPGDLPDFELIQLRRLLYGLSAILRLHFAQEEEIIQLVTRE